MKHFDGYHNICRRSIQMNFSRFFFSLLCFILPGLYILALSFVSRLIGKDVHFSKLDVLDS